MKTICIYHSRNLDGWMSAAIVKKWFIKNNKYHIIFDKSTNKRIPSKIIEDNKTKGTKKQDFQLHMLGWDYGDEIPDLSDYDKIIMCDVSFPPNIMESINNSVETGDFIWIDHHISAIQNIRKFTVNNLEKNNLYTGIRNTKIAACELTWKYFFPNEEMPEIVRLLGMYDSFRHKGTDEEQKVLEFQYGARQEIKDYEEAYWYLTTNTMYDLENNISMTDSILEKGQFIYEYLCTEAKQIYKKSFDINFNNELLKLKLRQKGVSIKPSMIKKSIIGYKFLCVNQERFNPVNFGIDYHKEGYDGFACFWYNNGKWNFSLYNDNGNVDCSIIAKQYGGGGHKGASGFVCDNKTMLKIINNYVKNK